jgi:putative CocE/NonD family hydrolase
MRLPPLRWRIAAGALTALLVVVAVLVVLILRSGSGRHRVEDVTIPASGGVTLAAEITEPDGSGRHPLVVMPASWGATAAEYQLVAQRFAARGYIVVAYAQRGFRPSTGGVDFAAPATQRDASSVIDWALAHTHADRTRIGMAGVSYGAGVSLLAAERDPRIKAVAAVSAWTDLGASFVQNGTLSERTLGSLLRTIETKGRPSAYAAALKRQLDTDPAGAVELLRAHDAVSSPTARVAALNANGTAVMIANGWEDSIFPPAQLMPFFDALTTPKRLQLGVGDHVNQELAGLFGRPDKTIDDTLSWFDHYLLARANGIDRAAPLQLQDVTTRAWHGFTSWPEATASSDLGAPGAAGSAALSAPATWTAGLTSGTDTAATSGPQQYGTSEDYRPPTADLGVLGANQHALVWTGSAEPAAVTIIGVPTVRFSLAASESSGTVFTYLYDVAPSGTGRLITMAPYTATGSTAASARQVSVRLQPTCWTLPGGDHIAVVVDTVDGRYRSGAPGGTVTLSSTPAAPASISVPIRK